MRFIMLAVLGIIFPIITGFAKESAGEWTRFRGPSGTGHGKAEGLPVKWKDTEYSWKIKLPGVGHASPVLWGTHLFTTCSDQTDGSQYVLCYNAINGKKIWEKKLDSVKYPHHKFNSFASSTPCVDAEYLFVNWTTKASNDLLCFDHDGNLLWRRDFGDYETQHGNGFSPIVHRNLVVLTHDHYGDSKIIAVDRKTGSTVWQTKRASAKPSSSTPCVYQPKDGPLQFVSSSMAHGCYAVDAKSGKILWETGPNTLDLRSVASPYPANGRFFASCGSGGRASRFASVIPPKSGKGKPTIAYSLKKNIPYVPTSLAKGNLLFLVTDGGIASCLDLVSGEMKWRERLEGNYFASPILVGEVIYAISREGKVATFSASEKYEALGVSYLNELTHNTPAVANDSLYFRTYSHLFRLPAKPAR